LRRLLNVVGTRIREALATGEQVIIPNLDEHGRCKSRPSMTYLHSAHHP
jgi:hypothetical protein